MKLVRLTVGLMLLGCMAACGTMVVPDEMRKGDSPSRPRAENWTLHYVGGCAEREPEPIAVAQFDAETLSFDAFNLRRDDDGFYRGGADFLAPMPEDERDVLYTVAYALRAVEDGRFAGTESITEGGGHSLDCPVELVYAGGHNS